MTNWMREYAAVFQAQAEMMICLGLDPNNRTHRLYFECKSKRLSTILKNYL